MAVRLQVSVLLRLRRTERDRETERQTEREKKTKRKRVRESGRRDVPSVLAQGAPPAIGGKAVQHGLLH